MKYYLNIAVMLGLVCNALPAHAQSAILPPSADPGRVEEHLQSAPAVEPVEPLILQDSSGSEVPGEAKNITFELKGVIIVGMTAYQPEDIQALYYSYIGQSVRLETIYQVAENLTRRYHEDGYFLSKAFVPNQKIVDGTVRIEVIEGTISTIERTGTIYESAIVDAILKNITESRPLKIQDLEKNLLLLNNLAGLKANAVLLPDVTIPNAVRLAMKFEEIPYIQNVSIDNFGTRYMGPYQLGMRLGANHLFLPYQQTQIAAYRSINLDELQYYYLSHSMPVDSNGTKVQFTGSFSKTSPGYKLESSNVEGRSYNMAVEMVHPLIRSRQQNLYVSGTIDWIHSETDVLNTELFNDNLRVARLSLNYDGSDHYDGSNLASVELSQGFDILGASDDNDQNLSRTEADGAFSKAVLNYARLQSLDDAFDLYIATSGQLSDGPLLSSEEFGYGGRSFGRGYDNSEITGDQGLNGVVEVRYNKMPEIVGITSQLYGFYDAGKVWNDDNGSDNISGTSTGLGIRFNVDNELSGDLGVGLPLTLERSAPISSHTNEPHVYFSLNLRF